MFSTKTLITLQPIDRFLKFQCLLVPLFKHNLLCCLPNPLPVSARRARRALRKASLAVVVVCVGVDCPLHHVLQPRGPACLVEAALAPLLAVGALLEDVVEVLPLLLLAQGVVPGGLVPLVERCVAESPAIVRRV